MAIQAGFVGLPNVGKSTIFNALTKSSVLAENYPFCTVDPNVAITQVPDEKLDRLAKIFKSQKIVPATVKFVDIAGLVKGAAEGEGLGNQFLGHIMGVDLIFHVLRCFEDSSITHVHSQIDPLGDLEVIMSELMLKDLEAAEKREIKIETLLKSAKSKLASAQQVKEWENEKGFLAEVKAALGQGDSPKVRRLAEKAKEYNFPVISLLSGKDFLLVANLSEDDYVGKSYQENLFYRQLIEKFGEERVIPVSAKIEFELAQMDEVAAAEMMDSLGIVERGLHNIISKAYKHLGLITFFTCGPKESHSWSVKKGTNVREAAGCIHSDLERGFICAEVYNCKDIFEAGIEQELRSLGKIRTEGKDYIVQDGDLINVRFNV